MVKEEGKKAWSRVSSLLPSLPDVRLDAEPSPDNWVNSPMDECNVLRGISQSTAFVGVTPGLGFRLILLLLFRGAGLSDLLANVDRAGGGGLLLLTSLNSSGSGMLGRVGSPSYAGSFVDALGDRGGCFLARSPSISSGSSEVSRNGLAPFEVTVSLPLDKRTRTSISGDRGSFSLDSSDLRFMVAAERLGDPRELGGGDTEADSEEREGLGEIVRSRVAGR